MKAFEESSARAFLEAYGLANAQQRKNKDIPEGGSKGVIMVNFLGVPGQR